MQKINMKKRSLRNVVFIFLAVFVLNTLAYADILYYPLHPHPADVYDLTHQNYYIWKVNLSILTGRTIASASLFIDNINDWQIETTDKLYISLLSKSEMNSAVTDNHMTRAFGSDIFQGTDNENVGNALSGYGQVLTVYEDENEYQNTYHQWINPAEDFTCNFSEAQVALLNSYTTTNKYEFGIGFDPDCHYYNDGVKLCYVTTSTVPEPATIALLSLGGLVLFRKKPS
jgi:hypothetical protein